VTQSLQDANGNQFIEGVLAGSVEIPIGNEQSFYTRHGELFAKLSAALALFFLVLRILQLRVVTGEGEPGWS
jgi:hypothetical protein